MDVDVIIYAMKLAVEANAKSIKYIKATLNNWSNAGVKTLLQAQEENQSFKSKSNLKKDIKPQKANKNTDFEQRDYSNLSFLYANKNIIEGKTDKGEDADGS